MTVSLIRLRPRLHRAPHARPEADAPAAAGATASRARVVDIAVYCDGRRECTPATLQDTFQELAAHPGGMAWIGLSRPDGPELNLLAAEFGLHELAVEDAIHAHQRPKIE